MPIKIGKKEGPHAEAAEEMQTEVSKTTTDTSDPDAEPQQEHDYQTEQVVVSKEYERIEVGMSFKMPVAQYTMLEFSVRRSIPYDPEATSADDVYADNQKWVESKLNALIEEQQSED